MDNKLYHPEKGIITLKEKKFSPLKGVQSNWQDEDGQLHTLDGTELPADTLDQELEQEQQKSQTIQEMRDEQARLDKERMQKEADEEAKRNTEEQTEAEKESQMHTEVLSELKNASEAIVEAVKGIPEAPEVEIPDHIAEYAKWKDEILNALKIEIPEVDLNPVIEAITKIKFPDFPVQSDYTKVLDAIKKSLPKETDMSGVIQAIQAIPQPEFPKLKFTKSGSLRVAMDEIAVSTGGGGMTQIETGYLQSIAGENYDTTSVDLSNMSNIVIAYKLSGSTVATETVTKTGTTYDIVKT